MANSAEQNIIDRLAQAPTFHPSGAKLFVPDWTLDPGDVVTITAKDNVNDPTEEPKAYQMPIYSMEFQWNGSSMAEVQSTGNQKREPLSALRRKEYQSGRRGYGMMRELEEQEVTRYEHYVEQTDAYRKEIYTISGVEYNQQTGQVVYQIDPATGEYILDDAGNKIPVYNELSNGSISGQIIQSGQRMATIIRQSGTVTNVFFESKDYAAGDRVLYPDASGEPYVFTKDHPHGPWKGTEGENADVRALGTLQSQIDNNTENFNIIYGEVGEIDGRIDTIEGSALWGDADSLIAINGKMRVEGGKLIITEGGGVVTERTVGGRTVQSGIWDSGNLTAGMIVQTINGTSETIISSDKINLDGYVTSTVLDTRLLNADSLFTDTGYANYIKAGSFVTRAGGSVTGDSIYATSSLSIGSNTSGGSGTLYYRGNQYYRQGLTLGPSNGYIAEGHFLGDSNTTLSLNHSHSITITELSGADDGKIQVQLGPAVTENAASRTGNFKIADTNAYKTGVASARLAVGLAPLSYTEIIGGNYPSSQTIYTDTTGRTDASGTDANLHRDITLSLDVDEDYVYMKHGSDVIARIVNPGSGTAYEDGYAAGQANASAEISGVALNRNHTSYSSDNNRLSLQIIARPKLVLLSDDDPPQRTETLGTAETVDDTMVVTVTNSTLAVEDYANGVYTITGSGGKVNIDSVDGQGGADIPVGVTSYTFTPTEAMNDVTSGTGTVTGAWGTDQSKADEYHKYNVSASVPIRFNGTTLFSAAASAHFPITVADIAVSAPFAKDTENGTEVSYSGKYTLGRASGGTVSVNGSVLSGIQAGIASTGVTEIPLTLECTVADPWDSANHVYNVSAGATLKQGNTARLTRSASDTLVPTDAINYGKTLVEVESSFEKFTGTPSSPETLESGETYELLVQKDGFTVDQRFYTVPGQQTPTVSDWSLSYQSGTDYTYKASVKVNGSTKESGNLLATDAYNNGWTGAYQSVGIFPTAVADLVPGGSPITIYAQAKATSGSAKSNVASVQVKARALNLKDETFTANDTYTVPEGYDGYGTVTVDVTGDAKVSKGIWQNGEITFTAGAEGETTQSVGLSLQIAGVQDVATSAEATVLDGQDSTGATETLHLTETPWTENEKTVQLRVSTTGGQVVASRTISAPSEIDGATLLSAVLPSGETAQPLVNGNYGVYLTRNGTQVSETPVGYYSVTTAGSLTYVINSTGNAVNVYGNNSLTPVGQLYPNTDVTVGSGTDSLRRRQITYNGRTGYVSQSALSSTKGSTNYIGRIGWTDEGSDPSTRTVSQLSPVILGASDVGETTHNVDVVYSDGESVANGAQITIDASAISGGGGSVDHIAKSGDVSYSENFKTVYFNATAYDENDTALHTNQVSANISEAWENGWLTGRSEVSPYAIQSGRSVTISSNTGSGGTMVYPQTVQGQQYDAMDAVRVIVNVPTSGGIQGVTKTHDSDAVVDWNNWRNEFTGIQSLSSRYNYLTVTANDGTTYKLGINASDVWTAGKNSVQTNVTISPSGSRELGYGGSVTVWAKLNGTNVASCTVSAPYMPTTGINTGRDKSIPYGSTSYQVTPGHNIMIQFLQNGSVAKTVYVEGKAS